MHGRLIAGTAALAALAGAVLAPSAAQAGTPNCPSGYFCAWIDSNFDGERGAWYGSDGYWDNNTTASQTPLNNNTSSWQNAGISGPGVPDKVNAYDGFYGAGARLFCLNPGYIISNPAGANDRVSSHYWASSC